MRELSWRAEQAGGDRPQLTNMLTFIMEWMVNGPMNQGYSFLEVACWGMEEVASQTCLPREYWGAAGWWSLAWLWMREVVRRGAEILLHLWGWACTDGTKFPPPGLGTGGVGSPGNTQIGITPWWSSSESCVFHPGGRVLGALAPQA